MFNNNVLLEYVSAFLLIKNNFRSCFHFLKNNEPLRRHAELVSASPKTTLKYVQNRMMFVGT
jgi:hypothetical protein